MLLITCPWCGPRAQIEFAYGGDAGVVRPADPEAVSAGEWLDHVYLRDNPRGPHDEWWQHSAGCRAWVKVRRDTWTHRVLGSGPPGADLDGDGSGACGAGTGGDGSGTTGAGIREDGRQSSGSAPGRNEGGLPGSGEGALSGAGFGEGGRKPPGSAPGGNGSSGGGGSP